MNRLQLTIALLVFTLSPAVGQAAKTDVVLLVNGNAITGELKGLNFGALSLKTDSMGTVSIDWEDTVSITTKQTLQVELSDGTRHFGHLDSADERFHVKVVGVNSTVDLSTKEIVRMTPIDSQETFWERLDGSISFGFSTQKGSEVTTLTSATTATYRTRRYLVGFTGNTTITDQPSDPTSTRINVGLNYQRFRPNRWFTDWYLSWERNDELGISSRYLLGGGLGRYLVQTNNNQFSVTAGFNGNFENYTGADSADTTMEGRLQMQYLHRRLTPEANATLTTNIYPLLSDFSAYRSETDLSFRREFIKDLYFDVTLYHSYTSDPPTGAEKEDYGVTTSLGYSW